MSGIFSQISVKVFAKRKKFEWNIISICLTNEQTVVIKVNYFK